MLALKRSMVAKPKGNVTWTPLQLLANARMQTADQLGNQVTSYDGFRGS